MAVNEIPLSTTPLQTLAVQLGEQSCRITVRQRRTGVFVDLYEQDQPVALGVKALDRVELVRSPSVGFNGRLFFVDTQGTEPPRYDGLGTRWLLLWEPT
jgi:hypothetical protein